MQTDGVLTQQEWQKMYPEYHNLTDTSAEKFKTLNVLLYITVVELMPKK